MNRHEKSPRKGAFFVFIAIDYESTFLLTTFTGKDEGDCRSDDIRALIRDHPRLLGERDPVIHLSTDHPRLRGKNILSHKLSRITPACAGKPDRHFYYIISRRVCQPFSQKKRRDLHPHPCPDHRPLFFRFHPAGCFELLFFAGHHPGALERRTL